MNDFDRPGAALDEPATRRSAGSRLAELGDRLSKTFANNDRVESDAPSWEADGDRDYAVDDGSETSEPLRSWHFVARAETIPLALTPRRCAAARP